MTELALLVLEDGTSFHGKSIGALGISSGELIFNTSITGYQEILTDPSYFHQIVVFTYPHIGNVGINTFDSESSCIQVSGLVIANLSLLASNFRHVLTLSEYLIEQNIVGISNIDTRKLTCLLRDKGVQNGCIISGGSLDETVALDRARSCDGLSGRDLIKEVTTDKKYIWTQGSFDIYSNKLKLEIDLRYHVIVYDFGVKYNIMRMLVDRGCRLTVVPARTSVREVVDINPDGILLANGPGDPSFCDYVVSSIQYLLDIPIPMFGICLGYQLLALASGAKIVKMKFGHHGSNHPVKDLLKDKVIITSQNHGFAVDKESLPKNLQVTHVSLFDGTLEGIQYIDKPVFGFQWHPEGSPGPHDSQLFFNNFINCIKMYHDRKNN